MKKATMIVVLALVVILALNSIYTVRENEYAARVQFSKIVEITD